MGSSKARMTYECSNLKRGQAFSGSCNGSSTWVCVEGGRGGSLYISGELGHDFQVQKMSREGASDWHLLPDPQFLWRSRRAGDSFSSCQNVQLRQTRVRLECEDTGGNVLERTGHSLDSCYPTQRCIHVMNPGPGPFLFPLTVFC